MIYHTVCTDETELNTPAVIVRPLSLFVIAIASINHSRAVVSHLTPSPRKASGALRTQSWRERHDCALECQSMMC